MRRLVRRGAYAVLGAVALVAAVLVIEVLVALGRPRLDDEEGTRPRRLVVGDGDGPPISVVWLGDSTTTGVGASDVTTGMAGRVALGLSETVGRPASLTVLGESGAQVHEVVDDQVEQLEAFDPDIVLVSVGANDVTALTRRPTFRGRYRILVDAVRAAAPDAGVVLVGVPDLGGAARLDWPLNEIAGWRGDALDDDIEAIADDWDVGFVDLADETGASFRSDPDRFLADDLFHPSDIGYEAWADAVLPTAVDVLTDSVEP